MFTEQNLNKKLISSAEIMPDKIARKAHGHKMEGYKLWKEGYVSNTKVKPNISAGGCKLFIVKSSASASTKSIRYIVYVHLNKDSSDVTHVNLLTMHLFCILRSRAGNKASDLIRCSKILLLDPCKSF